MHSRFLEAVKASGLTEPERIRWVAFAADFDAEELRPLVELIDESPGALERMTKASRLKQRYLQTQDPAILSEIRHDAHLELEDLLAGDEPAAKPEETGFAFKE